MPQMLDTSCVHIRRGDIVLDIERGEPVTVLDFYPSPNSISDPRLVCLVVAQRNDGSKVSQTANRFAALPDEPYEPRYGSDMDRPMKRDGKAI